MLRLQEKIKNSKMEVIVFIVINGTITGSILEKVRSAYDIFLNTVSFFKPFKGQKKLKVFGLYAKNLLKRNDLRFKLAENVRISEDTYLQIEIEVKGYYGTPLMFLDLISSAFKLFKSEVEFNQAKEIITAPKQIIISEPEPEIVSEPIAAPPVPNEPSEFLSKDAIIKKHLGKSFDKSAWPNVEFSVRNGFIIATGSDTYDRRSDLSAMDFQWKGKENGWIKKLT